MMMMMMMIKENQFLLIELLIGNAFLLSMVFIQDHCKCLFPLKSKYLQISSILAEKSWLSLNVIKFCF